MNFDYNSFCVDGLNKNRDQVGTVQGTFFDEEIVCRAYKGSNGDLILAGFMGKYKASDNRLWVATVWVIKNNEIRFYFGYDSAAGRLNKSNLLFEPEQYFKQAPPYLFTPVTAIPVKTDKGCSCNRCGNSFDDTDECHHCELEFAKKYDY